MLEATHPHPPCLQPHAHRCAVCALPLRVFVCWQVCVQQHVRPGQPDPGRAVLLPLGGHAGAVRLPARRRHRGGPPPHLPALRRGRVRQVCVDVLGVLSMLQGVWGWGAGAEGYLPVRPHRGCGPRCELRPGDPGDSVPPLQPHRVLLGLQLGGGLVSVRPTPTPAPTLRTHAPLLENVGWFVALLCRERGGGGMERCEPVSGGRGAPTTRVRGGEGGLIDW